MASGIGVSSGSDGTRSIRARLVLADQLTRDGDLTQAASVYAQVAGSYASAGRSNEAIAIVARSQQLGPAWFTTKTVGQVLEQLREAAVPVCTRAAEAHWRGGRITEALQFYYQATQLAPNDATALIRLAQAYEHQTLFKEATATFVVASRRLLEQANTADFIAVAEQILRIDGGHAATLRELAKAYLRVGEPRRAVAKLTALMQVVPEDPAGYEILAQAFACIGKEDVALSVLSRLGDDLRQQGLAQDADDLLWRASRWLPDNLAFQRKVAGLVGDEVPTRVSGDDDGGEAREGVMVLGPEDISQLDEDSGIYRDREGTSMLSLDDIAVLDDLLQTGVRPEERNTVTRADVPPLPMPPKRTTARPRRRDLEDVPTRVVDDAAAGRRLKRAPILTKHEGTIVLDLRDLAVVGESREESVVIDISDVQDEQPQYRLPDLLLDEESSEIELYANDLVTISKQMPAPPPLSTAIRPRHIPKAPTLPVKVAHPALSPTRPPGSMPGKPKVMAEDLDDERPTAMMAVNAADVMKDLFKKKRTGRDRSASLLDKLGPKAPRTGTGTATTTRRSTRSATTTAPQSVIPVAQRPTPAVTGNTQVTARPTRPSSQPTNQTPASAGVRWHKPTAPKRDKPK